MADDWGVVSQSASASAGDADWSVVSHAPNADAGGFWSSLVDHLSPAASKLYTNVMSPHLPTGEFLKTWKDQSQALKDKATDALDRGDYVAAASHGINFLANMMPGVGKSMDDAYEKIQNATSDQEVRAALGGLTGDVIPLAASRALPEAVGAAAPAAARATVGAVKAAAKAGGKDLAVGAAQAASGAAIIHYQPAGEFPSAYMGALIGKAGLKQMTAGAKAAYQAGKESLFPPVESPPPVAPTAPNPLVPVANASTFDPATGQPAPSALIAPPTPAANAAQYATGTLPTPTPPAPPAIAPSAPVAQVPAPSAPITAASMETPSPAAAPAPTPYDATGDALRDTYKANAAKADEVKAQWMFEHGITSDQLNPGSDFKELVDKIPNPNAKSGRFTTDVNRKDHSMRVKVVADLLDSKYATAASAKTALDLQAKGITAKAAGSMTPAELGASDAKGAADIRFQLQKLEAAPVVSQP